MNPHLKRIPGTVVGWWRNVPGKAAAKFSQKGRRASRRDIINGYNLIIIGSRFSTLENEEMDVISELPKIEEPCVPAKDIINEQRNSAKQHKAHEQGVGKKSNGAFREKNNGRYVMDYYRIKNKVENNATNELKVPHEDHSKEVMQVDSRPAHSTDVADTGEDLGNSEGRGSDRALLLKTGDKTPWTLDQVETRKS